MGAHGYQSAVYLVLCDNWEVSDAIHKPCRNFNGPLQCQLLKSLGGGTRREETSLQNLCFGCILLCPITIVHL